MPCETRCIEFAEAEWVAAVSRFIGETEGPAFRPADVGKIVLSDDLSARAMLKTPRPDGTTEIEIKMAKLGAALVAYCQRRAIPLPRDGKKSLRRTPKGIVLVVELAVR